MVNDDFVADFVAQSHYPDGVTKTRCFRKRCFFTSTNKGNLTYCIAKNKSKRNQPESVIVQISNDRKERADLNQ